MRKIKNYNHNLTVCGFEVSQVVSSTEKLELSINEFQIRFVALISKNDCLNDVKIVQMLLPAPGNEE